MDFIHFLPNASEIPVDIEEYFWLIEQLEQAQEENAHIKATLDKFEFESEPTQEYLFHAYKEIYKGKNIAFFLDQIEEYIKDLTDELEQSLEVNTRFKEDNKKLIEGLQTIKSQPTQQRNYSVALDRCVEIAKDALKELGEDDCNG